eukprot:m.331339 g.331339  ORF g.331339 m.331339 type:complete len:275 (-) comp16707_c0_seq1:89-913(-)
MDKKQVKLAVAALFKVVEANRKKSSLLPEEDVVYLQVAFKKVPKTRRIPFRIKIPHSLYNAETDVCVITKDPASDFAQLQKKGNGIESNVTVLGVSKVKSDFKLYEQKRQLCNSYDAFFADERVIPILPRLLGKKFYQTKKKPVALKLQKTKMVTSLQDAMMHTSFHVGPGVCSAIKAGHTNHEQAELVDNIMALSAKIFELTKKGNIQSINIKTAESMALPVFNSLPTVQDFEEEEKEEKKPRKKRKKDSEEKKEDQEDKKDKKKRKRQGKKD